ncbi:N-acetylneuraminate synthase [Flavobacteriaceae bacterium]|nr:N-acetylneuraminate synthase [Flavobacteriaceae bacterium]
MKKKSTYIIAEAGVNHNGSVDIALELIKKAKEIGADCVKFQTFKTEEIVTLSAPKANYQLKVTDKDETQFQMLKKLELSQDSFKLLKDECDKIGIDFMSTPYSIRDLELLDGIGVGAFKIASGQLTEHYFLKKIAEKNKPIILSTGMGTLKEVSEAVKIIKKINSDITVLHCTTNYPSLIEDSNINAMLTIKEFCNVRVGYSDHVIDNYACYAAVSLGAEIIEKHFTLDKQMEGPDHSCSLNPLEFKTLINGIRSIEKSLGNGVKKPTLAEEKNIYGMRRGIVAIKNIQKGDLFSIENLGVKRPLIGMLPSEIENLFGKVASKDIENDKPILKENIEW